MRGADLLTKNLGKAKFERFQRLLLNLPNAPAVRKVVTELIAGFQ